MSLTLSSTTTSRGWCARTSRSRRASPPSVVSPEMPALTTGTPSAWPSRCGNATVAGSRWPCVMLSPRNTTVRPARRESVRGARAVARGHSAQPAPISARTTSTRRPPRREVTPRSCADRDLRATDRPSRAEWQSSLWYHREHEAEEARGAKGGAGGTPSWRARSPDGARDGARVAAGAPVGGGPVRQPESGLHGARHPHVRPPPVRGDRDDPRDDRPDRRALRGPDLGPGI